MNARRARESLPSPGLAKIGHKKDGGRRELHKCYVSWVHLPPPKRQDPLPRGPMTDIDPLLIFLCIVGHDFPERKTCRGSEPRKNQGIFSEVRDNLFVRRTVAAFTSETTKWPVLMFSIWNVITFCVVLQLCRFLCFQIWFGKLKLTHTRVQCYIFENESNLDQDSWQSQVESN